MMSMSNSTIFKRHVSRNQRLTHQFLPRVSLSIRTQIDNSVGETLAKMTSRSSIYRMHQERHATVNARVASTPMEAESTYSSGVSVQSMTTKSTIFQRNARRAASRRS
eukprot:CAMPEP_0116572386 /NCGR_PEP_ID=MMETSP0397-20121206/18136_1 /TAXON_ID=216820 /ORGANISM="Cyclophora tenuis, Strain ECT3854" /LENGTH=107 /DNA_ID=CAMNT_0004100687 /DNA_START=13 /DNA_END=333 /DNA_ORIENTATION=+